MQFLQKQNAALHDACAAEKPAHTERLLKLTALRTDKGASWKRIEELTWRLALELSARERSVANERHTTDAVADLLIHTRVFSTRL